MSLKIRNYNTKIWVLNDSSKVMKLYFIYVYAISKFVLVYALHSLEYVLGLARFRVFVPNIYNIYMQVYLKKVLTGTFILNTLNVKTFIRYIRTWRNVKEKHSLTHFASIFE